KQLQQLRSEDFDIIQRWLGVVVFGSGCNSHEPAMYVRWEGDVIDLLTGKRLPDAESFDANNVIKRTILVGSSYFDIGNRLADIAMLDTSRKDGVHAQLFYGVSRADGLHSIYVGLKDPSAQAERDCSIYPIYFSSRGLVQGEKVV